jgi:uncharacterized surface protein with fasciclin (FAS1) repeats
MNYRFGAAIAVLSLALVGCASGPAPIPASAAADKQLTTFTRLVKQANLEPTLASGGPYTVFAPSDEAFKNVPAATLKSLEDNPSALADVLKHHVVAGTTRAADVKNGNVKSLGETTLALSKAGSFVTVEDAVVTVADVPASNGVIHVIDRVLMPPKKK